MWLFLRRYGWYRWCILQYYKRERPKWAEARWRYRDGVYATIGRITVAWASIELLLDELIDWYHALHGAKNIQADKPRTSLDRKLEYLNKMALDPGFVTAEPPCKRRAQG